MNSSVPSIAVHNLTRHYGNLTAINDVSFEVAKGEVVGFLGPNGAGKSTTLRIISGIIPADAGRAYICGVPVASHPDQIKKYIGYMPENNPLPLDMRVSEYLKFRGRLKEIPRRELKTRLEEVLEICDLNKKTRRKLIGNLSRGYRQRVGIADAILANPEVIIMDEPTVGLDPHQILMIRNLIDNLRGKMTVIISSHILAEVEVSCDRVIIINQGIVVASGTPNHLREEFISKAAYKISVKGDRKGIESALRSVDPEILISSISPPDGMGYREVMIKTPHMRHLGKELLARLNGRSGYDIRELTRDIPCLEDIFLAATRRTWKEKYPVGLTSGSKSPFSVDLEEEKKVIIKPEDPFHQEDFDIPEEPRGPEDSN